MKLDTRLIWVERKTEAGNTAKWATGRLGVAALTASERYLVTRKEMFTFI